MVGIVPAGRAASQRMKAKRTPSADWRTENLEEAWKNAAPVASARFVGSLHFFLDYCRLLRDVRQQFETDEKKIGFDEYAFFLRGGYFAFKYLNRTTTMGLKGTIFGGMNHGRHPKLELPRFMDEVREKALSAGKQAVQLLVVDEVKSGTGMGTILNLVEKSMNKWPASPKRDVNIRFYAVRPGSPVLMRTKLFEATTKWQGERETRGGILSVDIVHFAGHLPGYDRDSLCGVKVVSKPKDKNEAYEIIKSVGGKIALFCDTTRNYVLNSNLDSGSGSLVESLSYYAEEWTSKPKGNRSKHLTQQIRLYGCFLCDELYRKASGQSRSCFE